MKYLIFCIGLGILGLTNIELATAMQNTKANIFEEELKKLPTIAPVLQTKHAPLVNKLSDPKNSLEIKHLLEWFTKITYKKNDQEYIIIKSTQPVAFDSKNPASAALSGHLAIAIANDDTREELLKAGALRLLCERKFVAGFTTLLSIQHNRVLKNQDITQLNAFISTCSQNPEAHKALEEATKKINGAPGQNIIEQELMKLSTSLPQLRAKYEPLVKKLCDPNNPIEKPLLEMIAANKYEKDANGYIIIKSKPISPSLQAFINNNNNPIAATIRQLESAEADKDTEDEIRIAIVLQLCKEEKYKEGIELLLIIQHNQKIQKKDTTKIDALIGSLSQDPRAFKEFPGARKKIERVPDANSGRIKRAAVGVYHGGANFLEGTGKGIAVTAGGAGLLYLIRIIWPW